MRKAIKIMLLSLLVCILLFPFAAAVLLFLTGCDEGSAAHSHFPDEETVLEVQTVSAGNSEATSYYALAGDGRIKAADAFEPEEMGVYTMPLGCYRLPRDASENVNTLQYKALLDADGQEVSVPPEIEPVFDALEQLEHALLNVRIFKTQHGLFVYVEYNVNQWDPCLLFYFDPDSGRLIKLHTWNGETVTGLRVRDISRIQKEVH